MKVLLIQPPVEDFYHTKSRLQPIGLAYLKAAVAAHLPDVEVIIRDYHYRRGRRTVALPGELDYLRSYYPETDQSPFGTFHQYYHFGLGYEEIAAQVEAEKPDLVGISSMFSAYAREVRTAAEAIQSRRPVPLVVGGVHASTLPEHMLAHPSISMVIRGPGERPLVELLRKWSHGSGLQSVPNLAYKCKGKIMWNPIEANYPLAELPRPDFSDWPPGHYCLDGQPLAMVTTSRGCPQQCRFCAVPRVFGSQVEWRTSADVFAEILSRFHEGYRVFDFEDDHFAGNRSTVKELCRRLGDHFPYGEIRLVAMNGISHWHLDEELLRRMWFAGFRSLNLSLVSGDDRMCRTFQRPGYRESFQACVQNAHRLGYQIIAYQILGLPGESMESILDTLLFLAHLPVLIGPSPFYPVPGAPLYAEHGPFTDSELLRCRLTAFSTESQDCRRDQLYTLLIIARLLNFLKGLQFSSQELSLQAFFQQRPPGSTKESTGITLLQQLLQEKTLYASTPRGLRKLEHFDSNLFFTFWPRLVHVCTPRGQRLLLNL